MIDPTIFRFELPCPACGMKDMQLIRDLVGKDSIACRDCGASIDLTNEKWKSGLREMIEGLSEIFVIK